MAGKGGLGRSGADLAATPLQDDGLLVAARNQRCPDGELDIVAADREDGGSVLVFRAITTRSGQERGSPLDPATRDGRRKLGPFGPMWFARPQVRGSRPRLLFEVIAVPCRPRASIEHRVEALR